MQKDIIHELSVKGARGDLFSQHSFSSSLELENGQLKNLEKKEVSGNGLRVVTQEGQEGFISQNVLDDTMIDKVLELTKFGDKVSYQFPNEKYKDMNFLYHPSFEQKDEVLILNMGMEIFEKLKKEDQTFQYNFSYGYSEAKTNLINTSGFNGSYKESASYFSLSALKGENDKIMSYHESTSSRELLLSYKNELESLLAQLKNSYLPLMPILNGKYTVVFSPNIAKSFISILLMGFNGKSIEQGTSSISERIGKVIAPNFFTIYSDSKHEELLSSLPFDDEGVLSQTFPLIDRGVCGDGVYDLKTASKMKKQSSGNGKRTTTGLPYPSFQNIIVDGGLNSYKDMIKNIKNGIYIDSLVGVGMSNVISGEFIGNISHGFKIENGEFVSQIKDSMISGNVFDMVKTLISVSKERKNYSSSMIPYLCFDQINIIS